MNDILEFASVLVVSALIVVIVFASITVQRKLFARIALIVCSLSSVITAFLLLMNYMTNFEFHATLLISFSAAMIVSGFALYRFSAISSNSKDLSALRLFEDLMFNIEEKGVIITNNLGQIIDINAFGEKLLGFQKHELKRRHIGQLFWVNSGAQFDRRSEYFVNYHKDVNASNSICAMRRKDGYVVHLKVQTRSYIGVSTMFNLYVFTQRDASVSASQINHELYQFASVVTLVLDQNGIVATINPFGCKLLGLPESQVVGKSWIDSFVWSEDVEVNKIVFKELLKKGSLGEAFNSKIASESGRYSLVRWTAKRLIGVTDNAPYFIYFGHDISPWEEEHIQLIRSLEYVSTLKSKLEERVAERTRELEAINTNLKLQIDERKSIEERLITNQRLHNAVVDNFPEGLIAVVDSRFNIMMINGKELSALGISKDKLIGKNILEEGPGLLPHDVRSPIEEAFRGGTIHFEYTRGESAYTVNVVPLRDDDKKIHEVLIVMYNVTEHKKLERTLYKSIEEEKKLNELKSRFITMASHEFRTPLSTILSSIFLLESFSGETYEEKKHVHINRIKRTVNILTHTLNDFLRLGKLEEGQVDVFLLEVNLQDLVRECEAEIRPLLKAHQEITYHHQGSDKRVMLDINLFRSILMNLLSNAVKYSREDGDVVINTNLSDHYLVISVQDNGIGIPEEEQRHIFQRFFRGINVLNIEGTGIGLHIVKSYVEVMKGNIEFVSDKTGTTFTVRIPLRISGDGSKLTLT